MLIGRTDLTLNDSLDGPLLFDAVSTFKTKWMGWLCDHQTIVAGTEHDIEMASEADIPTSLI